MVAERELTLVGSAGVRAQARRFSLGVPEVLTRLLLQHLGRHVKAVPRGVCKRAGREISQKVQMQGWHVWRVWRQVLRVQGKVLLRGGRTAKVLREPNHERTQRQIQVRARVEKHMMRCSRGDARVGCKVLQESGAWTIDFRSLGFLCQIRCLQARARCITVGSEEHDAFCRSECFCQDKEVEFPAASKKAGEEPACAKYRCRTGSRCDLQYLCSRDRDCRGFTYAPHLPRLEPRHPRAPAGARSAQEGGESDLRDGGAGSLPGRTTGTGAWCGG